VTEPRALRRRLRTLRLVGLILVSGGAASAEPNPKVRRPWLKNTPAPARAPGERGGSASSSAESVPPSELETPAFVRQGFFARAALGSGVFTASSGVPSDPRSFVGMPVSLEVFLGSTLSPWLALGAGYTLDSVGLLSSQDGELDGDEPDLDSTHFVLEALSLFITMYPEPNSPWYGFATLGAGMLQVRTGEDPFQLPVFGWIDDIQGPDPSGVVWSLGAGYDWWVGERWTLGVSARVLGAFLSTNELAIEQAVTVLMPSLSLAIGYH